jgi:hypothetical protein
MDNKCPKCGREFLIKSYFSEPDETGIIAMVAHNKEIVQYPMGGPHTRYTDRCFLTQEEWNKISVHEIEINGDGIEQFTSMADEEGIEEIMGHVRKIIQQAMIDNKEMEMSITIR